MAFSKDIFSLGFTLTNKQFFDKNVDTCSKLRHILANIFPTFVKHKMSPRTEVYSSFIKAPDIAPKFTLEKKLVEEDE